MGFLSSPHSVALAGAKFDCFQPTDALFVSGTESPTAMAQWRRLVAMLVPTPEWDSDTSDDDVTAANVAEKLKLLKLRKVQPAKMVQPAVEPELPSASELVFNDAPRVGAPVEFDMTEDDSPASTEARYTLFRGSGDEDGQKLMYLQMHHGLSEDDAMKGLANPRLEENLVPVSSAYRCEFCACYVGTYAQVVEHESSAQLQPSTSSHAVLPPSPKRRIRKQKNVASWNRIHMLSLRVVWRDWSEQSKISIRWRCFWVSRQNGRRRRPLYCSQLLVIWFAFVSNSGGIARVVSMLVSISTLR